MTEENEVIDNEETVEQPDLETPVREEEILESANKVPGAVAATPAEPEPPAVDPMDRKLFVPVTNEISALQLPNGCLVKVGSEVTFVPAVKLVPAADRPAPKGRGFAAQ